MNEHFKSRIGILGGSFNPVHTGHLMMAQDALETFDLSTVLFVPCDTPAHKSANALLDPRHRVAMLELAIEGDLRFELCEAELERGGISYAVHTVQALRARYPRAELYFIIGSDSLRELHLWKDVDALLDLCRFITFARPGQGTGAMTLEDIQLKDPWPRRLLDSLSVTHVVDISSTEIRHRIAEGMSIRYLVPPGVEMYIVEHGLYK